MNDMKIEQVSLVHQIIFGLHLHSNTASKIKNKPTIKINVSQTSCYNSTYLWTFQLATLYRDIPLWKNPDRRHMESVGLGVGNRVPLPPLEYGTLKILNCYDEHKALVYRSWNH